MLALHCRTYLLTRPALLGLAAAGCLGLGLSTTVQEGLGLTGGPAPAMSPWAGLAFVACAVGLGLLAWRRHRLAWLGLAPAGVLAIASLAAWLIPATGPGDLMRMSPNAATGFLLAVLGMLTADPASHHRRQRLTAALGMGTMALGVVALFGHLVEVEPAYRWGGVTQMPASTALGLVILGAGVVASVLPLSGRFSSRQRWIVPIAAAVAGTTMSVMTSQALLAREHRLLQAQFSADAAAQTAQVERALLRNVELIASVQALYQSSEAVTATELAAFIRYLNLPSSCLPLLMSLPPLEPAAAAALVHAHWGAETTPTLSPPAAGAVQVIRDHHTPVSEGPPPPLAALVQALQQARDGGTMAAVDPSAVAAARNGADLVLVVPAYRSGPPQPATAEPHVLLDRYVLVVIDPACLARHALEGQRVEGLELTVTPAGSVLSRRPALAGFRSQRLSATLGLKVPAPVEDISHPLEIAGHTWLLQCRATPAYLGTGGSAWLGALLAGMVLTGLTAGYTNALNQRASQVEGQVRRKTRDLLRAGRRLAREMQDHQRTAAALRASEHFARCTVDALSARIAILDEAGNIVAVNTAWHRFAAEKGAAAEVNINYLAVCDAATGAEACYARQAAQAIRAVISGRDQHAYLEYPCSTPGEQYWFALRVTRFAGQGPARVVVAHEDITFVRQAHAALREMQERFERAIDATSEGLWDLDLERDQLWTSPRVAELLGYRPGDVKLTLESFYERMHPEDRPRVQAAVREHLRSGIPFDTEYRLRTRQRGDRWFRARGIATRNRGGWPARFVGTLCDITERRATETALRHSEERFRRAVLDAPCPILLHTDEGQVLQVNAAWTELTGYTLDDLPTVDAWEAKALAPDGRPRLRRMIEQARQGGAGNETGRFQILTRHGQPRTWDLSIAPSGELPDGRRLLIAMAHDGTLARQAEAMERDRLASRQAVEAMEQVLGVVGHELRTPLGAMRVTAELLLGQLGAQIQPDTARFLRMIQDEAARMAHLVTNLLEAARLHSSHARWKWETLDIAQAVASAVEVARPLVNEQRVALRAELEPGSLTMRGDGGAIERLLINLLANAARHTTEGAIVVRAAARTARGRREITLTVEDTGQGIDEHLVEKLGQAFVLNAGAVGANHVSGSGLGLAICKGIVAAHGGRITVASRPGQGSRFQVVMAADLAEPCDTDDTRITLEAA